MILVTICARAGSKGLPGKHLLSLKGKPLITWTIEHAMAFLEKTPGKLVVSTDDYALLFHGAACSLFDLIIERPDDLATDIAPKMAAIRHALVVAEDHFRQRFDYVVDLDVTNPLRTVDDISECLALAQGDQCPDTVITVTKARRNPYFNQVELYDKLAIPVKAPAGIACRQSAPPVYDMNASIYVYRRAFLRDSKNTSPLTMTKTIAHVMPEWTAFDIDTPLDFEIVKMIAEEKL